MVDANIHKFTAHDTNSHDVFMQTGGGGGVKKEGAWALMSKSS